MSTRAPIAAWRLDDLELLVGQLAGLEQDRVRDRDLADVVQRRGPVDQRHLAVGQVQAAGQARGERADALGVLVRVVVAVTGGLQDSLQELLLGRFGVPAAGQRLGRQRRLELLLARA